MQWDIFELLMMKTDKNWGLKGMAYGMVWGQICERNMATRLLDIFAHRSYLPLSRLLSYSQLLAVWNLEPPMFAGFQPHVTYHSGGFKGQSSGNPWIYQLFHWGSCKFSHPILSIWVSKLGTPKMPKKYKEICSNAWKFDPSHPISDEISLPPLHQGQLLGVVAHQMHRTGPDRRQRPETTLPDLGVGHLAGVLSGKGFNGFNGKHGEISPTSSDTSCLYMYICI